MARFLFLLLVVLLGTPAAAGMPGQQAHQAGLVAYARGDLEAALDHFRAAREAAPDLVPAHFYEGLTLADLGRPEEAARAFQRVLQLDPGHLEARLELARVQAGIAPAPPGPGSAAEAGSGTDAAPRWWGMRFVVAAGYDSRVLVDPEDATISIATSGGVLDVQGGLSLRPLWSERHRIEGFADFRRRQFLGRDADDLSLFELLTGGRYGFRFPAGEGKLELRLRYDIGLSWADGGPVLQRLDGEHGFHLQAERHAWTLGVDLLRTDRVVTRAYFAFRIHHFAGRLSRFNHRGYRHCLEQGFELARDRLELQLGACLHWAQARSEEYDHITPLGRGGLALRLGALTASAEAWYAHARYQRSQIGRTDDRLGIGLDLSWPFLEVWQIKLGWQHGQSWSNESAVEYGRDRALLQLVLEL